MKKSGTICSNCGGEYGIHNGYTMQCPVGGVEAPVGRKDEWMTTTFDNNDEMLALAEKYDNALDDLIYLAVGAIEEGMNTDELASSLIAYVTKFRSENNEH